MELVKQTFTQEFSFLYPPHLRPLITEALEDLTLDAARLGLEVLQAERKGISFREATRRPGEFPLMTRVHYGVIDILQLELGQEERQLCLDVIRYASEARSTSVELLFFAIASASDDRPEPALFRFLIFELIRLGIWVGTWTDGAVFEAAGTYEDLDLSAENSLRHRCSMAAMQDTDIRPFSILLAEAYETLQRAWGEHSATLGTACPDYMQGLHDRMNAARLARSLDAGEAAIIRNAIAARRGEEPIQLAPLSDRHTFALPNYDVARKKASRLRTRLEGADREWLEHGDSIEPRKERLIDLLIGSIEQEAGR